MTQPEWSKTCEAFKRIAAREGVRKIAGEVPANHVTVYRIIRGDTAEPNPATKAGIERVVEQHQQDRPE